MKYEFNASYANRLQDAAGCFISIYTSLILLTNIVERRKNWRTRGIELAAETLPLSGATAMTISSAWRAITTGNIFTSYTGLFAFTTAFSFPFAGSLFSHLDDNRAHNDTSDLYWLIKTTSTALSSVTALSLVSGADIISPHNKSIALSSIVAFPAALTFLNYRASDNNHRDHDRNIIAKAAAIAGATGMALKLRS